MAYKIIKPADHEAWLKERENGIGSSEATFNEALFKKECKELYKQYLVTPEEGEPEFKVQYPRKTSARKTEAIF